MGSYSAVNDWIGPTADARVSVLDNGFVYGDGVYETLRTYGGRPFHIDLHLARLRRSAARLAFGIPESDAVLSARLDEVLRAAGNAEAHIRIVVSRGTGDISYRFDRVAGPTVVMIVKPLEEIPAERYDDGAAVSIVSVRRNSPAALDPAIKACNLINNILAIREAQARGALEALLLNAAGQLAEGASSNLFVVNDGRLLTPPLSAGILPGITREIVLARAEGLGFDAREIPLSSDDLLSADEAFLTSSIKEVMPVVSVDGSPIGDGRPGPISWRVLADYREYAAANSR